MSHVLDNGNVPDTWNFWYHRKCTGNVMCPCLKCACIWNVKFLILQDMYRKCTVNVICPWSWKCAGHMKFLILQEMYRKFHVSLLEIVHEMWNFWHHWKCAGNAMFPCHGNVHEMWNFHKLRKCACQVTFPKNQITTVFVQEFHSKFPWHFL